ncbi:MAG: DnaJ C-terminal domain-containing protein [Gammaproteobacteria bacterium]
MEFKDYYAILGVAKDATQDEIKRAYRKLARKFHPDVSQEPDAEARFKELNEANEVLKDPEKRAAYDQLGSQWRAGQAFDPPPDWDAGFEFSGGGFTGADARDYSEFFESLFGGRSPFGGQPGAQARRGRGEDHHAKILIRLEDSFQGAQRSIQLQAPELDAQGHVRLRARTLNLRIPQGIGPGQKIRLAGQGAPPVAGGPPGDLYLEIEFEPHPLFQIEGRDLYLNLPLAPWEAALGVQVQTPTPGGKVEMKIPTDSQSGQRLRLKGRGLPGQPPGDLYAVLKIVNPPAGNAAAREAYERLARELHFDPRAAWEVQHGAA